MGRKQGPRKGSMQVWPRCKADKFLPRVNWKPVLHSTSKVAPTLSKPNFLGFIGYKAGMASAYVKDNTPDSMTKGKKIIVPVTIIECPPMRILSVRFYKNKKIMTDVLNDNLDKELGREIRMPGKRAPAKETIEKIEKEAKFDDVKVVVYSEAKKTKLKKVPDISELAVCGKDNAERLAFIKENLSKEISVSEVFTKGLVDARGLTKGFGFSGSVARFGVHYRSHKAEKGQRRVGSIGGWHPIGVRFNVPRPGQLGLFTRIALNKPIVVSKKLVEGDVIGKWNFINYGFLNTDYMILAGSVQGPCKRQMLLTSALRSSKKQSKKQYELIELR
jgi:large subunit ribosomal protein L3